MDATPPLSEVESRQVPVAGDPVRRLVFSHIVAATVCLAMTRADRGVLITPVISQFFYDWCMVIAVPAVFSLWVFPPWMLILIATGRARGKTAVWGVIAEILLTFTHWYVMVPMFSTYGP
jgi:hypothetical protein